ncbi:MAG TPA: cytochrome c oxidase subunit 3 [Geminicoccus sp.]|uniref:cytochrome c oxidase subunit 3 n=1 Tax=Geminicoccus sp. TaxID=2024832 RepID=UPI002B5625E4|nr:cytochrome c oxidase subunit 3 [Geminicoccus sp.]HWL70862.1 cytochrome c oxidase subunit 3 [Geminicoccus sp.]
MSAALAFILVVGVVVAWWLARHGIMAKPWLEPGLPALPAPGPAGPVEAAASLRRAKAGLVVFLGVAGSLFALFVSAYLMRMGAADWWPLPLPRILWINTGLLMAGSLGLHGAQVATRHGSTAAMRQGLLLGGAAALAFLLGQILAWRELLAAGHGLAGNPAASFFYVLSGVHGLHVAGGLVALGHTTAWAWRDPGSARTRVLVELCATYWHFLLLVWLVLFGLLAGWANDFAEICRQVLS